MDKKSGSRPPFTFWCICTMLQNVPKPVGKCLLITRVLCEPTSNIGGLSIIILILILWPLCFSVKVIPQSRFCMVIVKFSEMLPLD